MGIEVLVELNARFDELVGMNKEVLRSVSSLGSMDKKLKDTSGKFGVLGKAFRAIGDEWKKTARDTLSHLTALAAFDGLKVGVGLMVDMGKSAVNAAADAEQLTATMNNVFGKDLGDRLQGHIDKMAPQTEFIDDKFKGWAVSLGKAGMTDFDTLARTMAAIADVGAKSEDHMAGASAAVEAFRRVMAKGTFDAKGLLPLGLNADSFYGQLAKSTGKGIAQVKNELEKGVMDTGSILDAIYDQMEIQNGGKPLGDPAKEMGLTLGARLTQFKNIPDRLLGELETSKGLDGFKSGLNAVIDVLDPLNKKGVVGREILNALGAGMARFGAWMASVNVDKLIAGFHQLWTIGEAVISVIDGVMWSIQALNNVGELLSVGLLFVVYKIPDAIENAWLSLKGWITKTLSDVGDWFVGVGEAIVDGISRGIKAAWSGLKDSVTGLGKDAVASLRGVLGIHSPSKVAAVEVGMPITRGVGVGVREATPALRGVIKDEFAPRSLFPKNPVRFNRAPRDESVSSLGGVFGGGSGATFSPTISVNSEAGRSNGRASITNNVQVDVNLNGTNVTAADVEVSVRLALQRVFEQMQAETG